MASGYRPRIADAELRACLGAAGAVVIEGPKASGKTRLAQQLAASTVLLDVDTAARQALAVDPTLVLEGPRPRLLDEWQVEPALWNQVRRAVDAADAPGQFLLTGSAVPADDAERHTGAGRFSFLRLRPMCLLESGAGQGGVSLAALLEGEPPSCADPGLAVADLATLSIKGLQRLQYLDATQALMPCAETDESMQIHGEIDRVYLKASTPVEVIDARRRTLVSQQGFCDVVVWNPGPDKVRELSDMPPDDYLRMLCVEAAVIGAPITLAPGARWQGRQTLRALPEASD
jgi:hypothetical protein